MTDHRSRRHFLAQLGASGAAFALTPTLASARHDTADRRAGAIELAKLPYAENALDPVISSKTIGFHYGKHHAAYVRNVNALIQGTPWADLPLDEIIAKSHAAGDAGRGVFEQAAQVWNHTFYWRSMKPNGGGKPAGKVLEAIEKAFGGYEQFREKFVAEATSQFGSGWGWLVQGKDGALAIRKTSNADLPQVHDEHPLLTVDVWEHAYYLDWQNQRKAYVEAFVDKLVDWEHVAANLR